MPKKVFAVEIDVPAGESGMVRYLLENFDANGGHLPPEAMTGARVVRVAAPNGRRRTRLIEMFAEETKTDYMRNYLYNLVEQDLQSLLELQACETSKAGKEYLEGKIDFIFNLMNEIAW